MEDSKRRNGLERYERLDVPEVIKMLLKTYSISREKYEEAIGDLEEILSFYRFRPDYETLRFKARIYFNVALYFFNFVKSINR